MRLGTLVVVGVAAVGAALVLLRSPSGDAGLPARGPAAAVTDSSRGGERPRPAPAVPPERAAVEPVGEAVSVSAGPTAAGEPSFDPTPVAVAPWFADIVVVDEQDRPVADAVVTVWAAQRVRSPFPQRPDTARNCYSGHTGAPLHVGPSDATGHLRVRCDLECVVVAAAKDGVGAAPEVHLWNTEAALVETRLVLEAPVSLRGVVLRADGVPVAGATVRAHVQGVGGGRFGGGIPRPEPVTTDTDGRFAIAAERGFGYGLQADLDGERTLPAMVWVVDGPPAETTLRFAGAVTLSGLVVGPDGVPVAGATVWGWRDDPDGMPDGSGRLSGATDERGAFSLPVARLARHALVASRDGYANSAPVWFEPNEARPHATGTLRLLAFAPIAGRVLHADGAPFIGVNVAARPEAVVARSGFLAPGARQLFGRNELVATAEGGTFELRVHPGTTWTLSVSPIADNRLLRIEVPGVAPGRTDVEVRISDAELAGCVVSGTIERDDGQPPGACRVDVIAYDGDQPRGRFDANVLIEGARFTLPPLPLGRRFGLRVAPGDARATIEGPLAPMLVGPFTTDRAELSIDVRLEPWGEVPVLVLDPAGAPARAVTAAITPAIGGAAPVVPRPVDTAGRVTLRGCTPGPGTLRVYGGQELLGERSLRVAPGANPEVVVQLEAPPAAGAGR